MLCCRLYKKINSYVCHCGSINPIEPNRQTPLEIIDMEILGRICNIKGNVHQSMLEELTHLPYPAKPHTLLPLTLRG